MIASNRRDEMRSCPYAAEGVMLVRRMLGITLSDWWFLLLAHALRLVYREGGERQQRRPLGRGKYFVQVHMSFILFRHAL